MSEIFGVKVANSVQAVTDEPGRNRRMKKRATYMKLRDCEDYDALFVKMADRLANVRACTRNCPDKLKMYRREHEAFRLAVYREFPLWQPLMDDLDNLLD